MPNEQSSWNRIITAVKSFHTFCALELLVILSAFGLTVAGKASANLFYVLLCFALLMAGLNLYFALQSDSSQLTFRVRVNKSSGGSPLPLDGIEVSLFKNGKLTRSRITDEQGEVAFTENIKRKDELYVKVTETSGIAKKAALYSEGQFQIIKTILVG